MEFTDYEEYQAEIENAKTREELDEIFNKLHTARMEVNRLIKKVGERQSAILRLDSE